jgi:glycosyltransferase involved in cell wall biosynthesis
MKIAIYSHSIAPSIDGVCRRVTGLLHELVRQGHSILLFTLEDEPEELPADISIVSLDCMIFPSYPGKKVAKPTCNTFSKILKGLKDYKPDVMHVVADGLSHMFTIAGILTGVPVVGSIHTDLIDLLNTHNAYWYQKLLIIVKEALDGFTLDSCATTSSSFADKLLTQGVSTEHTIITAVDVDRFSPKKRSDAIRKELMFGDTSGFLCIYVGRISNEKRLDVIIEAVQSLREGESKAYLAIIGDGPSAQVYAKKHGKENRIYCKPKFLNHDELAEMYASSELHVSASEFETLGNTVLESFACEVPVVVPYTQGFRDTVQHEVDGFLFAPGDPQSARKYIQILKDDHALRKTMGARGRDNVKNRTVERVVVDLLGWYELGIQRRRKRMGLQMAASVCALSLTASFGIFAFFVYDWLVNVLLKQFISYADPDHAKKRD